MERWIKAKYFKVFYNLFAQNDLPITNGCTKLSCYIRMEYLMHVGSIRSTLLCYTAETEIPQLLFPLLKYPQWGSFLCLKVLRPEGFERVQKWSQRLLTLLSIRAHQFIRLPYQKLEGMWENIGSLGEWHIRTEKSVRFSERNKCKKNHI